VSALKTVTLEVADPGVAEAFYDKAFGPNVRVGLRASDAPTSGFRGFTMSLVVSQPNTVDGFLASAIDAGATTLKPAAKTFWGYGGGVDADGNGSHRIVLGGDAAPTTDPDGFVWEHG
jgi:hypothetical protein